MQLPETTSAVKEIGLPAVIILLMFGMSYFSLRYLARWFTERLDRKDALIEQYHNSQIEMQKKTLDTMSAIIEKLLAKDGQSK